MRSLILGAGGLVGSALTRCLPDALQGIQMEASEPQQRYIDITKHETLLKVFRELKPEVVYLAAAIAHVDKCEDYGTSIVNVRGSTNVLRLCEQFGSKLVFFSSSYVFDGRSNRAYFPTDETNPLQAYGIQKATMENLIINSSVSSLIVRTVGVFGTERKKKNFAKQVISSVFSSKTVYAPDDQYMNPILSDDLARITVKLAEKGAKGIYHVAGNDCVSKYDFAKRIANYFECGNLVKPISTPEMNQRALRPQMGCLDCSDLWRYTIPIPNLDAGVQKFLASEYNG